MRYRIPSNVSIHWTVEYLDWEMEWLSIQVIREICIPRLAEEEHPQLLFDCPTSAGQQEGSGATACLPIYEQRFRWGGEPLEWDSEFRWIQNGASRSAQMLGLLVDCLRSLSDPSRSHHCLHRCLHPCLRHYYISSSDSGRGMPNRSSSHSWSFWGFSWDSWYRRVFALVGSLDDPW